MKFFYRLAILSISTLFIAQGIFSTKVTAMNITEPPLLISPFDGETRIDVHVALKWCSRTGQKQFRLILEKQAGNIVSELLNTDIDLDASSLTESVIIENRSGTVFVTYPVETIVESNYVYHWRIKTINKAKNEESPFSDTWSFAVQENLWPNLIDEDDDGIPDTVEEDVFQTDKSRKTVFIRPIITNGNSNSDRYWDEFAKLFNQPKNGNDSTHSATSACIENEGFADVTPLTNADIEVVVIGCEGHFYSKFDNFHYNPACDSDPQIEGYGKPVDILEVYWFESNAASEFHSANIVLAIEGITYVIQVNGHTYFQHYTTHLNDIPAEVWTWYWDTLGFTPWLKSPHSYCRSYIYSFPLDNYFKEGAYPMMQIGELPEWELCLDSPTVCRANWSPFNYNDKGTVQFSDFTFDSSGRIQGIGTPSAEYSMDAVKRRVISHEIGHALLRKPSSDTFVHCSNPDCIMYKHTLDWIIKDFGHSITETFEIAGSDSNCQHSEGFGLDIRRSGIVKNYRKKLKDEDSCRATH